MRTETGAFAVTCITYALAARKRSYYPLSSDMKEIMYELETIANPLKAFVQEHCIVEAGAFIFTDVLYET